MSNPLTSLVGGAAAGYNTADLAKMTEAQRLAWYKKMGQTPPPVKPSPLERAVKWVGDKLGSPAVPAVPAGNPGSDVSLIERLKAGNIDEVGSEAYNRWGAGGAAGAASELEREGRLATPADAPPIEPATQEAAGPDANRHFTKQEWVDAPEYRQSNPMWDGLPADEFAMNQGA